MHQVQRNFNLGIIHETLWGFGFGFMNPFTILPLALLDMGGSASLAGLLAGILFAGQNVPQIFSALVVSPRFTDPPSTASMNAMPLLGVAGAGLLFWLMPGGGPLKITLFIVLFLIYFIGVGIVVPHWMAAIARCIPEGRRGRFFGTCFFASNLVGAFAGYLASAWTTRNGLAWGYTLAFGLTAVLQLLSVWVLSFMKPLNKTPRHLLGSPIKNLLQVTKRWVANAPLRSVVWLSVLGILATSGQNFFTVYLKEVLNTDRRWFELYTPALGLGSMVGVYAMGHMSDYVGPRRALMLGLGLAGLSLSAILFLPPGPWQAVSYFTAGFGGNIFVVFMVVILKHSGKGFTTIMPGFVNSVISPFNFGIPLLLSAVVMSSGYRWAFFVSILASVAGILIVAREKALDR